VLDLLLAINIFSGVFLSTVYFYLYRIYKDKYMGIWSLSWLFMGIRVFLDLLRLRGYSSTFFLFSNQLFTIFSASFLIWGIYLFNRKKIPRGWIIAAFITTLLSDFFAIFELPFIWIAIPTAFFVGIADLWTGVLFTQLYRIKGLGKDITGYVLIVNGVLNCLYPLIPPTTFFMLTSLIWLAILIGILLVYFQKIQSELSASEERFRLLAENAKDIIFRYTFSPSAMFDYLSPSVEAITGYTVDEFYVSPDLYLEILQQENIKEIGYCIRNAAYFQKPFVFQILTKKQELIWVEVHLVPIYESGMIVAIEGIVRDITARIQVEQEMFRLNQLHIVGETAASIAHEIRNPMTTVHGFLQLLTSKGDLDEYKQWFDLMKEELERANHIIKDYLSITKEVITEKKNQNLNQIVKDIYPLLESNSMLESKQITLDLQMIPEIELNDKEVRQLILNLAQNGLDSMDDGGLLTIKTYLNHDVVVLEVQDHGSGMEPDILKKIGTPFFTTKEKGTGLGLTVCYRIAERHNANINVTSAYKEGTTFKVEFPIKTPPSL